MSMAEREGFEPSMSCPIPLFESGQFNHSCTSPYLTNSGNYFLSVFFESLATIVPMILQTMHNARPTPPSWQNLIIHLLASFQVINSKNSAPAKIAIAVEQIAIIPNPEYFTYLIKFIPLLRLIGTPGKIRTYDLWLRKPALYPAELRVHTAFWKGYNKNIRYLHCYKALNFCILPHKI